MADSSWIKKGQVLATFDFMAANHSICKSHPLCFYFSVKDTHAEANTSLA